LIRDGETLTHICKQPGMPTRAAVKYWMANDEEFRKEYDAARRMQAESFVDRAIAIAESACVAPEGVNPHAWANAKRLEVDTLKWSAARLDPSKWGDKQEKYYKHEGEVTFEIKGLDK